MLLAKIHYRSTKSTAWFKKVSSLPMQIGGSYDHKHQGHYPERNGEAVVE